MKKVSRSLSTPAMIVAVVALIVAVGGSAVAGGVLTTKKFNKKGVQGPIAYATTTTGPVTGAAVALSASCPAGYRVVGGGIKSSNPATSQVDDSYPTSTGWAGHVIGNGNSYTTTAVCAKSQSIIGLPPAS